MVKRKVDWKPEAAVDTYKGYEIWEYEVGPHEINEGEVDGDVSFDEELKRDLDED
jgi:hypothetical protein